VFLFEDAGEYRADELPWFVSTYFTMVSWYIISISLIILGFVSFIHALNLYYEIESIFQLI